MQLENRTIARCINGASYVFLFCALGFCGYMLWGMKPAGIQVTLELRPSGYCVALEGPAGVIASSLRLQAQLASATSMPMPPVTLTKKGSPRPVIPMLHDEGDGTSSVDLSSFAPSEMVTLKLAELPWVTPEPQQPLDATALQSLSAQQVRDGPVVLLNWKSIAPHFLRTGVRIDNHITSIVLPSDVSLVVVMRHDGAQYIGATDDSLLAHPSGLDLIGPGAVALLAEADQITRSLVQEYLRRSQRSEQVAVVVPPGSASAISPLIGSDGTWDSLTLIDGSLNRHAQLSALIEACLNPGFDRFSLTYPSEDSVALLGNARRVVALWAEHIESPSLPVDSLDQIAGEYLEVLYNSQQRPQLGVRGSRDTIEKFTDACLVASQEVSGKSNSEMLELCLEVLLFESDARPERTENGGALSATNNLLQPVNAMWVEGRIAGVDSGAANSPTMRRALTRVQRASLSHRQLPFEDLGPESPNCHGINVIATASQLGLLETCGCKVAQVGGVARRSTVVAKLSPLSPVLLDLGSFMNQNPDTRQSTTAVLEDIEFVHQLSTQNYDAIVPASSDLEALSALLARSIGDELRSYLADIPFVACNVPLLPTGVRPSPFVVVDRQDETWAIVGWSGSCTASRGTRSVRPSGRLLASVQDPELLLEVVLEAASHADGVIVVGQIDHTLISSVRDRLPSSVLAVFTTDPWVWDAPPGTFRNDAPPQRAAAYKDGRLATYYVGNGPGRISTYSIGTTTAPLWLPPQLVNLDSSVPDDREVRLRMNALSDLVAPEMGIGTALAAGQSYIGAESCRGCHPHEYLTWSRTRHATAMETLRKVQRDRWPSCVKCHVAGYGFSPGYADTALRETLNGVQCENCHGPGGLHSRSLSRADIIKLPERSTCLKCHDEEHSDQFAGRFDQAWLEVSHGR